VEHFFEWFRRQPHPERPWLILGKGPTFGLRSRFDLTGFHLLSLNHAVREQRVQLAHLIDLDVVDACGETLTQHAGHVVLPWYPHVRNAPGSRALDQLVPEHALLRRLADEGRLLWYDLSTAARRHGPGPVVRATHFSAEAAVSMLALAGVSHIRSLGVDGGSVYSNEFEDLAGRTLLANGQPGFDLQFQGIARTIHETGVDFAPLDQPAPIVVGVLTGERTMLADRVLEFSVRKRTSMSIVLTPVRSPEDIGRVAASPGDSPAASGQAELRRAIVLRSGSLALDDLRKLWARPLEREVLELPRQGPHDAAAGAPAVFVATARDAARFATLARAVLDGSGSAAVGTVAPRSSSPVVRCLPASWDRRDTLGPGYTSFLCYAEPSQQPWISLAHPLGHLWVAALVEAVCEGFLPLELVRSEVRLGHVRPSLLEQVERGNPETVLVSRASRRRDEGFTPMDGQVPARAGVLTDPGALLRALARQARRQVRAFRRRAAARA
jgi:hypothetical protein